MVCSKLKPNCRGLLLTGDPFQLPPTEHVSGPMGALATQTIFDLWNKTKSIQPVHLTTCYRCNDHLLEYHQLSVYHNNIHSGLTANISQHLLHTYSFPQRDSPTAFIDCKGVEMSDSTGSKYNFDEVRAVLSLVKQLLHLKAAQPSEIMILTFYYGQTVALQETFLLEEGLEYVQISSVDSAQGREQNIVILSTVRAAAKRLRPGSKILMYFYSGS